MHEGKRHEFREATGIALQPCEARSMWRIRSSIDSTCPNIIVEVVGMPRAMRRAVTTSSHSFVVMRVGEIVFRKSVVEDLRRRAQEASQGPTSLKLCEIVRVNDTRFSRRAELHLFRREGVDVNLRRGFLHHPTKLDVTVAGRGLERGPACRHTSVAPMSDGMTNAHRDFVMRQKVALLGAHGAGERTELAVLDANVGEVDVAIDNVGDPIAAPALSAKCESATRQRA